ncbi:peptidase M23 [Arenicella chitinivorans]|uniref:Peptidase M23 n=1 Tax=Arenicella chitinivorans TaxID=1329800 RepID=A0A918VJX6_9GAMM|nr:M23 family metallopeptidase [Arenicella chitinivorans]GHA07461.1 peptidase M23 [Arenicella chitinivorans]
MPSSFTHRLSHLVTDVIKPKNPHQAANNRPPIRKRHWFLGTSLVLAGCWITHTTTATIKPLANTASPVDETIAHTPLLLTFAPEVAAKPDQPIDLSIPPTSSSALNSDSNQHDTAALSLPMEAPSSASKRKVNPPPQPIEIFTTRKHKIKRGESLGIIFRKQNLGYSLPHKLTQHDVAKQLTSIAAGKSLEFAFDAEDKLRRITYPTSYLTKLVVDIKDDEITDAKVVDLPYTTHRQVASAEITSSLFEAGLEAGLGHNIIMEMVRIFGWDVDFVQDIRSGDSFHVIYQDHQLDGKKLADGEILAAEFNTQGRTYRAIRYQDNEGNVNYYTPEGDSMLGTFLRSPVKFSRISSRFGKRRHPISKKWKAHKGVDYAASRGTPIRATADGKVIHAGNKGGYGKTVVLRHAGRFTTLYAHMNGYAKGIKSGARVKQGQTIGYVGSTGYSTGPHLHYEFRVDGVHQNSLTYKTPKASSVPADAIDDFQLLASTLGQELDSVQSEYMLAQAKQATEHAPDSDTL